MRWVDITWLPLSEREPKAPPHPSKVAVIVSVDYRRAVDWCRRYDIPCPPRRGSPYIVTESAGSDKIRGCNFYDDDEMIVLGPVSDGFVDEVHGRMKMGKMRGMGPRPPVPT